VNSQKSCYWSAENPRLINELPLHDEKISIWCAISARRIIGPIFYEDTVNGARYVNNILSPFFAELKEEEKLYSVFQQDSAASHMAHASLKSLREILGYCIFSHGLWPPHSPDLSPYDFYLWGSLKDKVYKANPYTLEELRNIRCEILAISGEELQSIKNNVFLRYTECIQSGGQHFQHLL
jgi:hypothetical protein